MEPRVRTQFSFLAEAVARTDDQRMVAHGIFLGPLVADKVPVGLPQMSFIVGLSTTEDDRTRAHMYKAQVVSPDGSVRLLSETRTEADGPNEPPGDALLTIEFSYQNVVFDTAGGYVFELLVDEALMTDVKLFVEVKAGEGKGEFSRGYAAIGAANLAGGHRRIETASVRGGAGAAAHGRTD